MEVKKLQAIIVITAARTALWKARAPRAVAAARAKRAQQAAARAVNAANRGKEIREENKVTRQ